jgi:hypothetical protein
MHAETHPVIKRRRWGKRLLISSVALIAVAVGAAECLARTTKIERTPLGTSVIEPRGFLSWSNLAGLLRVEYTQWVDAVNRRECFTVGERCTLTGNDPDRDGKVDQIYVLVATESILPYLRDHDRELGGLRLFVHLDPSGHPQVDEESLAELQRVVQALFDDGMQRHAGEFGPDGPARVVRDR